MSPTPPALKDEGYISAANPGLASPGPMTPVQGMGDPSMGMGTIRGIGLEDESYSPYRGHARVGSGNSHGMPSPLYDSSTGRGIDRIQSRDIVALMDHVRLIVQLFWGFFNSNLFDSSPFVMRSEMLGILRYWLPLCGALRRCGIPGRI
jgi:hypothetical protein